MFRSITKIFCFLVLSVAILSVAFAGGDKLRYQLAKGSTYKYTITSDTKAKNQVNGQDMNSTSWSMFGISIAVQDVGKGGELICVVKVDENLTKIDSPMLKDTNRVMKELNGKRARMTVSALGKTLKTVVIDTIPPMAGMQMAGAISPTDIARQLFIELPEQDMSVGGTWSQTRPDTTNRQGMKIIMKPKVVYKVVGNETVSGYDCLKITFDGTASVYGTGSNRGMEMVIDGTNKMKGTLYFAAKEGVLVSAQQSTTSDANISGTGEQMFSMTQSTTTSSKVVLAK
jgi:hypothetical protein